MSSVLAIMVLSATLSQLLSNVPLVALYLPMLANPDVQSLMVLAASNVITKVSEFNFIHLAALRY